MIRAVLLFFPYHRVQPYQHLQYTMGGVSRIHETCSFGIRAQKLYISCTYLINCLGKNALVEWQAFAIITPV